MNNLYNFIFWFNPYQNLWYAIERGSQLDFFNGNREKSKYFSSEDLLELVEIVKENHIPIEITLSAYGGTVNFKLIKDKSIRYYGKTNISNESLWRTCDLLDNEAIYKSEFGWGVIVDKITRRVIYPEDSEWFNLKID
jgi:hypothetical protein